MYFALRMRLILHVLCGLTDVVQAHGSHALCEKTSVAILGAGVAGMTAAQTLVNASVTDFLIVEYRAEIGGRVAHTTFGSQPDGTPYVIELGANWVQGLVTSPGPENPIWTLVGDLIVDCGHENDVADGNQAKKYNLTNTYSNYSLIETFNETGAVDYTNLLDDFEDAYAILEQDAGNILRHGLQDRSARAGLSLAGWKPGTNRAAQAVEWWDFDFEYAFSPDQSSQEFAIVNYNTTFYQWSDENNYVFDHRGFNTFIKGEASTFLAPNDRRLRLNTVVTNITYHDHGVTIYNHDGSCIWADYAICTFSLGVLQNDVITFDPPLPSWKQEGIATFAMGSYTKIFLQFPPDRVFWNRSTQFFLYADPTERGNYPVWQSLDGPGFLPGSGIIFVTVLQDQSARIESQSDAETQAQALAVLRHMFGAPNVPDPIAFFYPRWSTEPWAYGSYSNWPPGTSLHQHQNLRANVGRLFFAGEATSTEYFGFLHGAYYEGQSVAKTIAACLNKKQKKKTDKKNSDKNSGGADCHDERRYERVKAATGPADYNLENGWTVSSFQTNGFE